MIAEGLRSLIELQDDLMPVLIEHWFRSATVMDLYGIAAIQIVVLRSEPLIWMLWNIRNQEFDHMRQEMLDQALALA